LANGLAHAMENTMTEELSDIERLVAIEDIKQLKSRRDRAVDMKDWATLESLHAPDHKSISEYATWNTAAEMVANISHNHARMTATLHHSHTPDITIQSRTKASGIWAMEDNDYWMQGDEEHWLRGFGFYYETYEKRDGRWVFTSRELKHRTCKVSPGGVMPWTLKD
jgi:hypothetical protein